jgi:glycosyltransferase involved in cell wall biosynthesis
MHDETNLTLSHTPTVSIGLAVYNGDRYLEEALDSILAQTFTDFELIISDNASTDRTAEICQRYAAQDPRIRYSRNETNIGGANNENLTFRLARGKYFRWAAHDDKLAPELLEKCVAVLAREPEVVLCHTMIAEIDENGTPIKVTSRNNGASEKAYERFATIALSDDFLEETYGLMRSEILGKTSLQANYTASDRTLMCEISLYGRFYQIEEPLFYKRFHPGNVYVDWRTRMAWFGKEYLGKIVFPWWLQFVDYFRTIHRVSIPAYDKMRCYLAMGRWLLKNGKKMVKDLLVAMYMLIQSPRQRLQRYEKSSNWTK